LEVALFRARVERVMDAGFGSRVLSITDESKLEDCSNRPYDTFRGGNKRRIDVVWRD